MSVWHLWLNFKIVFILCSHLSMYYCETKEASGPYRSTIVSVTPCESPNHPYMKEPPMTFTPMVHNTSTAMLLSGNITISKDVKNTKYRMKSAIWENNKWRPNYLMNDIGCHGMLLHLICTATGIKYDRKKCMYLKGQYYFKNMDVNSIQHLWATKMEYGRLLWRSEVFHQKQGTYFCHEYETLTEPI